ncbi:hypothetical protein XENTR_v10004802 [Xenopus tropicalis]|nr:hypothetical protein XENTR_v10004802 [Xenopus tropicalis]
MDKIELCKDMEEFFRKLRLKEYFHERPHKGSDTSMQQEQITKKKVKWTPPAGLNPKLDQYIDSFRDRVKSTILPKAKKQNHTLSLQERNAVKRLKNKKDIIIKPADKGGAVYVVMGNDPYEQPTEPIYEVMPCTPQVQPAPYEQPTDPLYDNVMPCTPQVQPAPPPYSAQVPAGHFVAPPPKGPSHWSLITLTTTRTTTATTRTTTATTRTTTATTTSTTSAPICKLYCTSLFYYYTCISTNQICDGIQQCLYGDDELNCATTTPSPCQMYCSYTYACIRAYQICNRVMDCLYGDDERNCATTTLSNPTCQMYCSYTYACIRAYQICNRVMDCLYADDERNCASTTLSNPTCQMYCSYTYTCIRAYQICNGVMDCLYGDDERNCGCGVSNNSVTGRIVGGTYANLGIWPWQVSVRYNTGLLCGGSIISPKWIVTAAHCVYGPYSSAPGWKVFAGTLTLPSYYDPSGYSVERIITHPGFYSVTYNNDIALMKLSNGITFGYSIQPVCLPNSGMFWEAGTASWISGWGSTYEGGSASPYLQYAAVPLIDSNVCNLTNAYNGQITASMICAGYLSGGVDTCQGDSGGPLVTQTNSTWWLVGDTSWGDGCARANKPGVYGNMATFLDWIYLQMRTYS